MKFNRQYPITHTSQIAKHFFFVADFYCHQKSLVIELDGKIHENQQEYDEARDVIMMDLGLKVIRFTNDQIDKDIDVVLKTIEELVTVA